MRIEILALAALLVSAPTGAEDQAPAFRPVDEHLLGVWEQIDAGGGETEIVEITPVHCAHVEAGQLQRIAPIVGQSGDEVVTSYYGRRSRLRFSLEGDTLTTWSAPHPEADSVEKRYRRLKSRPEAFDLKPLRLGDPTRPLTPERLAAIKNELATRHELDQAVRQKMSGGASASPADMERMSEVDRDNTRWLIELVTEVGWIDSGRFGREAALTAFLIVQHSGHLPLMLAALPELEKEAKETADGGAYALLYDRTQLTIGRKQLYGSQIGLGPDGMFVSPLEDPEGVDARRAELGMQPLGEYLVLFRSRNGGREVPIHEEF